MYLRLSFVTLVFALLTLGMPVKRDVISDLQDIMEELQSLGKSIDAISPSDPTLGQLYEVHEIAGAIQSSLETATNDVNAQNPPFDNPQANAIVEQVKDIIPLFKTDLSKLVDKKPVFVTFKATPMVEQDLEDLKSRTDMFSDALIKKSPADKTAYEKGLMKDVDDALTPAIDEFSTD